MPSPVLYVDKHKNDSALAAVKLRRGSVHPGVVAKMIEEAGVKVKDYLRGKTFHLWTIPTESVTALEGYFGQFTPEQFKERVKELRATFPKTEKTTLSVLAGFLGSTGHTGHIVPMTDDSSDSTEDDDS
jgi:hypothetical protein